MSSQQNILPLFTRVTHFDGGPGSHGKGTIVAYNGVQPIPYFEERPVEAAEMANRAGLISVLAVSAYNAVRCPYVVQWDYRQDFFDQFPHLKEQYPDGYRDVYEPDSIREIVSCPFVKGDQLKMIRPKDPDGERCEGGLEFGEIVTVEDITIQHHGFITVKRANGRSYQLEKNRFELYVKEEVQPFGSPVVDVDFEKLTDDELITIDPKTLTFRQREERTKVLVRKVLWQDIVAKGPDYRFLATNVCRYQDGCGLREAGDAVQTLYYRTQNVTFKRN